MRRRDRRLPERDRADLLDAARTEAVRKEHDVAFRREQLRHRLMPQRKHCPPRGDDAVHPPAAMEGDHGGMARLAATRRGEQESPKPHRRAGRGVAIERIEGHALRHDARTGLGGCSRCNWSNRCNSCIVGHGRRWRATAQCGEKRGHARQGLPRLAPQISSPSELHREIGPLRCRKSPMALHAANFSANGLVYAGDDEGRASVR